MRHGTAFTKMRLFFHSLLDYKHTFATLCEILYARCIQLCAEAFELFRHAQLQLIIICKTVSSRCILQWAKEMEERGWQIWTIGNTRKSTLPLQLPPLCTDRCVTWQCQAAEKPDSSSVWLNPSNSLFYLFNVCTYHSEFIMAPLSRNSSNKNPSLSHKTLAMTVPTEAWPWIFFHVATTDATPLSFHPWVIMTNPRFIICNYSWQKSISFSLCCRRSAQIFWGHFCVTWSALSAPTVH